DNIHATAFHHGRVLNCLDDGGVGQRVAVTGRPECHDPGLIVHPDHAQLVVAHGGNGSGDMRSMKTGVRRVGKVVREIITVIIVHVSVPVIIHSVAGDLAGIGPHVA